MKRHVRNGAWVLGVAIVITWIMAQSDMWGAYPWLVVAAIVLGTAKIGFIGVVLLDKMFGTEPYPGPDSSADADVSGWGHYRG